MNPQEILSEHGLRSTADRKRILSLFMNDRAWSVSQLHDSLKDIDLSTVYRNVNALTEKGILSETPVKGKESRFELNGKDHHAHRVCESCEGVFCVPCPLTGTRDRHNLEIYTRCSGCPDAAR
jgi:Fur family ferric uptake transcriptional regulator